MLSVPLAQLTTQTLIAQQALGSFVRDRAATLEETQVYIGLNDADTRGQEFETDHYVRILKGVCRKFGVPFSFDVVEGGYVHDDGEYTEEKSIVLTFIDVPQETVDAIAREMCTLFHQESVLVASDRVHVRSIRETL